MELKNKTTSPLNLNAVTPLQSEILGLAFDAGVQSAFKIVIKRLYDPSPSKIENLRKELEETSQIIWSHEKLDELQNLIENLNSNGTTPPTTFGDLIESLDNNGTA